MENTAGVSGADDEKGVLGESDTHGIDWRQERKNA